MEGLDATIIGLGVATQGVEGLGQLNPRIRFGLQAHRFLEVEQGCADSSQFEEKPAQRGVQL